ncbi:MAG: hypothetical protein ACXAC8_15935 [Candidatus Hodarchaeales archaeon]
MKNHLQEITITSEEMDQLADRALILLSFKETDTQNLRFLMNLLGIRTVREKRRILKEIFRLIQKGIVYVPKGLPQLLDPRTKFNRDSLSEIEKIDLCLLCPYEKLIQEIQKEIAQIRE